MEKFLPPTATARAWPLPFAIVRIVLSCLALAVVADFPEVRTRRAAAHPPSEEAAPRAQIAPPILFAGHKNPVYSVLFSPDGKRLASASQREVKVWNVATGKEIFSCPVKSTVYGLSFSPDGKRLAVGIAHVVKVLDAMTGKETFTFLGTPHYVLRLAFSPDGNRLSAACGSSNNTGEVATWDAATGKQVGSWKSPTEAVLNVAYSADGRFLASASGGASKSTPGGVTIWEARTGRVVRVLLEHTDNVYGVAFSPDGRFVASSSGVRGIAKAGDVKVWEVASGKAVLWLVGHAGAVFSVAFSPDGRHLATSSEDKTVKLWDTITGQEIRSIPAHTGPVYSLAFSPDGRQLASASGDPTVKVWDMTGLGPETMATGGPLTGKELTALWADLSGADASQAYRSVWVLVAVREETVSFLQGRLRPVSGPSPQQQKQLARWLRDLDHDRYEVREKAAAALAQMKETALPALRHALTDGPSLEVRRRVEHFLEVLADPAQSQDRLAELRAVTVLEHIGTPEAGGVLEALARGLPEARLTQEAKASLGRLAKPQAASP